MIYDCCLFFNEFELLAVRLAELENVVDKFIVVESDCTHAGHRKPLWLADKRRYFARWANKLIVSTAALTGNTAPEREQSQRQWMWRALEEAHVKDEDYVMMSDVDEIPHRDAVPAALQYARASDVAFSQNIYQYFLNAHIGEGWLGTRMTTAGLLRKAGWSMHEFRHKSPHFAIKNAGWHFGFMGGAERIKLKIQSYMHTEFNRPEFTDPALIQSRIDQGKDPFDRTLEIVKGMRVAPLEELPLCVQQNPHLYANWLK